MGLTIGKFKTKTTKVDGKPVEVPELDKDGQPIALWSIDVPPAVESAGFPKEIAGDRAAIEAHIAKVTAAAKPAPAPSPEES